MSKSRKQKLLKAKEEFDQSKYDTYKTLTKQCLSSQRKETRSGAQQSKAKFHPAPKSLLKRLKRAQKKLAE